MADTDAAERVPAGWDGILAPGEKILWQGRPKPGIAVRPRDIGLSLFGVVFAGFAIFWMSMASHGGAGFALFGLPFLAIGLYMAGGQFLWSAFVRGRTWYTLTDERAIVATEVLGYRSLKSYPIEPARAIEVTHGSGGGNVYFAHRTRRTKNGYYHEPIGFERIDDANTVVQHMRAIQRQRKD